MTGKGEFDAFADGYDDILRKSVEAAGEESAFFAEYKVKDVRADLGGGRGLRILDFGSGVGTSVPWFRRYFPDCTLTCADVSRRSLDVAAARFPGAAEFVHFDGDALPFADASFDVAFAACVFHHIPAALHAPLLAELRRVLAPGGRLFLFEHNPYNPATVYIVKTCPLDENAVLIRGAEMRRRVAAAGFTRARLRYRLFFPGFLALLRPLERHLAGVPLGAQYSVSATKA